MLGWQECVGLGWENNPSLSGTSWQQKPAAFLVWVHFVQDSGVTKVQPLPYTAFYIKMGWKGALGLPAQSRSNPSMLLIDLLGWDGLKRWRFQNFLTTLKSFAGPIPLHPCCSHTLEHKRWFTQMISVVQTATNGHGSTRDGCRDTAMQAAQLCRRCGHSTRQV